MTSLNPPSLTLPSTTVGDPRKAPGLRWGVIAPGGIANTFISTMHTATASRLVAVCSRSLSRAEHFANKHAMGGQHPSAKGDGITARPYENLHEFLRDPEIDAVYVASPHAQHHELARPVIEAGKPVVIEKAFTLNSAQAIDLLTLAREKNVFVMEAMWSRFLPHYDVIRQAVAQGMIGEVTAIVADHGQYFPFDAEHRLFNPNLGGGALLDLGVYPLAFAHWIAGALDDLHAVGSLTTTGVDDTLAVIGRGSGAVAGSEQDGPAISVQSTLSARTANHATVVGREGRIDVTERFYSPANFTLTRFAPARYGEDETVEFTYEHSLPFTLEGNVRELGMAFEIAEAARCVSAGELESPKMTWRDTLEVMETMDEIRRQLGVAYPSER